MVPPSKSSRTRDNGRDIRIEPDEDRVSNSPVVLTEKILQLLPLYEVAKMSVLSKKWRNYWLGMRSLRFDQDFWRGRYKPERTLTWLIFYRIISSIFFLHQGPIHEFYLDIPAWTIKGEELTAFLAQWLCFLSSKGVKKITLQPRGLSSGYLLMPSHIYLCMELEEVILYNFTLNFAPGSDGFVYLKKLELISVKFNHDIVERLIASCPNVSLLKISKCKGVSHLVIDAPRLENLILDGVFGSLSFKNVPKLALLNMSLKGKQRKSANAELVSTIKNLECSYDLKSLTLGCNSLKLLARGGFWNSLPLAFTHLNELSLLDLDFGCRDVFLCTFGLLQSCSSIRKLIISVKSSENMDDLGFNSDCTLHHLQHATVGVSNCSIRELKVIEYLLGCSPLLEILSVLPRDLVFPEKVASPRELKLSSHSRMLVKLNQFCRASPKVKVICPEPKLPASSSSSEHYSSNSESSGNSSD